MLKIILKNLWQRRRQNTWLFVELIIITILTWIIADPTIVGLYDLSMDLGYDADRIVRVSVKTYPEEADQYNPAYQSAEIQAESFDRLLTKASGLPKVEISSYLTQAIDDDFNINNPYMIGDEAVDTLVGGIYGMFIMPGEKFFSLYGIESTDGSPSADELDSGIIGANDIVITESVDRTFWPDRRGLRDKRFIQGIGPDGDTLFYKVAAIIKDFRYHVTTRSGAVAIVPNTYDNRDRQDIELTLRLAHGVDADDYIRDYGKTIADELRIGNYYVDSIISQRKHLRESEENTLRNLLFFIAALFLINLIIGVVGCVWLQTGKRIPELGVLRSYGALKSQIIKMLIGESVILTTIAFIIGELIYLQYAVKDGLAVGNENNPYYIEPLNIWVNNFAEHFAIVSAIVYVIIIVCVILGTYFPARHVSQIEPVDALRDE
ncbi:MAG: ABC transporter permease [Muribaculaceae bacterium]|nr:ABC transporter permease [Muribaculaceae bacterium]